MSLCLLQDYVNMWLAIKQQCSSYPPGVVTEQEKDAYIEDYLKVQGIRLDKEAICHNPGLRLVAKLFLNTSWGKFSQRLALPNTVFLKTKLELARLMNDPTKEIIDAHLINEDLIAVDLKCKDDFLENPRFQCDVLGVMTTSYARLKLYEAMEKLGTRLLYTDTDSVIFMEKPGDLQLDTGPYLGCLQDEVKDGNHITRFCASAPKSYCLKFSDGAESVRTKGITLNYINSQIFTFESVRRVILGHLRQLETAMQEEFRRVKHRGLVYKRPYKKTFQMTFYKRVVVPGKNYSVPYGYRGYML